VGSSQTRTSFLGHTSPRLVTRLRCSLLLTACMLPPLIQPYPYAAFLLVVTGYSSRHPCHQLCSDLIMDRSEVLIQISSQKIPANSTRPNVSLESPSCEAIGQNQSYTSADHGSRVVAGGKSRNRNVQWAHDIPKVVQAQFPHTMNSWGQSLAPGRNCPCVKASQTSTPAYPHPYGVLYKESWDKPAELLSCMRRHTSNTR